MCCREIHLYCCDKTLTSSNLEKKVYLVIFPGHSPSLRGVRYKLSHELKGSPACCSMMHYSDKQTHSQGSTVGTMRNDNSWLAPGMRNVIVKECGGVL